MYRGTHIGPHSVQVDTTTTSFIVRYDSEDLGAAARVVKVSDMILKGELVYACEVYTYNDDFGTHARLDTPTHTSINPDHVVSIRAK
jgi:hypothetical protein